MMHVFAVTLEACDPARDRFRSYHLEAGPDLFGVWLVDVTYGRIGTPGRTVRHLADDEAGARKIVRQCLQRRASAPRRIGVAYQLRELHDPGQWVTVETPVLSDVPGTFLRSRRSEARGAKQPSDNRRLP